MDHQVGSIFQPGVRDRTVLQTATADENDAKKGAQSACLVVE